MEFEEEESPKVRIVKSAMKGSRAVATVVLGGLAMAFGAKGNSERE